VKAVWREEVRLQWEEFMKSLNVHAGQLQRMLYMQESLWLLQTASAADRTRVVFCQFCVIQGSYRPWKVLEFYCSEFQALESPEKRHRSWNILESPGIINQRFWNF